jgi:hypothetical protein
MIKTETTKAILHNRELLWEAFENFYQALIQIKQGIENLTEIQKHPIIAFIYSCDVYRGGHITFMDLNKGKISLEEVTRALNILNINDRYIQNIKQITDDFIFPCDDNFDWERDEKEIDKHLDAISHKLDTIFKGFAGREEFQEKISEYVFENHSEFFIFSD